LSYDLALTGGRVVLPGSVVATATIGVRDGRIAAIADGALDAAEVLDVSGLTVLPGVIDQHFHTFRGFGWETHENGTRAALKGGVTTVVDMPIEVPAVITAQAFRDKLEIIAPECHVDYALFGGYLDTDPDEMTAMAQAGAAAFKLFTGAVAPPGMYPGVDHGQALDAFRRAAALGLPTTVHCEDPDVVAHEMARVKATGRGDAAAWDEARPWFAEVSAAQSMALLAQAAGARIVVAHISSPETAQVVAEARSRGADMWVETCHHYLCVSLEDMAGDNRLKWNPPSRRRESVDALWEHLRAGRIHSVASDHAPSHKDPALDVWEQNPGAGNGSEIMLSVVATEALQRGIGIERIAQVFSENPARIFGLSPRKGAIRVGADADLTILETDGRRTLDARELEYHEQEPWSPFDGRELRVYPVYTVIRGRTVFAEGQVLGEPGYGEFITPTAVSAALDSSRSST
jgi:allantoinase